MTITWYYIYYNLYLLLNSLSTFLGTLVTVAFYTLAERKIMSGIQRRKGPNVVGFLGVLQPIIDGLKLVLKENIIPLRADATLFLLAPVISFVLAYSSWAFIPFSSISAWSDFNLGLLCLFSMSSLSVYGVILGGWASNSKYAFLGALRSTAQMISYEIVLGIIFLTISAFVGSINIFDILQAQQIIWFFVPLWPFALLFIIVMLAETNRAPFDLPEAEAEIVAGYNVEYSGIAFALYFLAEYSNMLLFSALFSILFLGGGLPYFDYYGILFFIFKLLWLSFSFIIIRAALPRLRYDQLMTKSWTILLPFAWVFFLVMLTIILLNSTQFLTMILPLPFIMILVRKDKVVLPWYICLKRFIQKQKLFLVSRIHKHFANSDFFLSFFVLVATGTANLYLVVKYSQILEKPEYIKGIFFGPENFFFGNGAYLNLHREIAPLFRDILILSNDVPLPWASNFYNHQSEVPLVLRQDVSLLVKDTQEMRRPDNNDNYLKIVKSLKPFATSSKWYDLSLYLKLGVVESFLEDFFGITSSTPSVSPDQWIYWLASWDDTKTHDFLKYLWTFRETRQHFIDFLNQTKYGVLYQHHLLKPDAVPTPEIQYQTLIAKDYLRDWSRFRSLATGNAADCLKNFQNHENGLRLRLLQRAMEISEDAFIVYMRAFYIAQRIIALGGDVSHEFSNQMIIYPTPFDENSPIICEWFVKASSAELLKKYNIVGGATLWENDLKNQLAPILHELSTLAKLIRESTDRVKEMYRITKLSSLAQNTALFHEGIAQRLHERNQEAFIQYLRPFYDESQRSAFLKIFREIGIQLPYQDTEVVTVTERNKILLLREMLPLSPATTSEYLPERLKINIEDDKQLSGLSGRIQNIMLNTTPFIDDIFLFTDNTQQGYFLKNHRQLTFLELVNLVEKAEQAGTNYVNTTAIETPAFQYKYALRKRELDLVGRVEWDNYRWFCILEGNLGKTLSLADYKMTILKRLNDLNANLVWTKIAVSRTEKYPNRVPENWSNDLINAWSYYVKIKKSLCDPMIMHPEEFAIRYARLSEYAPLPITTGVISNVSNQEINLFQLAENVVTNDMPSSLCSIEMTAIRWLAVKVALVQYIKANITQSVGASAGASEPVGLGMTLADYLRNRLLEPVTATTEPAVIFSGTRPIATETVVTKKTNPDNITMMNKKIIKMHEPKDPPLTVDSFVENSNSNTPDLWWLALLGLAIVGVGVLTYYYYQNKKEAVTELSDHFGGRNVDNTPQKTIEQIVNSQIPPVSNRNDTRTLTEVYYDLWVDSRKNELLGVLEQIQVLINYLTLHKTWITIGLWYIIVSWLFYQLILKNLFPIEETKRKLFFFRLYKVHQNPKILKQPTIFEKKIQNFLNKAINYTYKIFTIFKKIYYNIQYCSKPFFTFLLLSLIIISWVFVLVYFYTEWNYFLVFNENKLATNYYFIDNHLHWKRAHNRQLLENWSRLDYSKKLWFAHLWEPQYISYPEGESSLYTLRKKRLLNKRYVLEFWPTYWALEKLSGSWMYRLIDYRDSTQTAKLAYQDMVHYCYKYQNTRMPWRIWKRALWHKLHLIHKDVEKIEDFWNYFWNAVEIGDRNFREHPLFDSYYRYKTNPSQHHGTLRWILLPMLIIMNLCMAWQNFWHPRLSQWEDLENSENLISGPNRVFLNDVQKNKIETDENILYAARMDEQIEIWKLSKLKEEDPETLRFFLETSARIWFEVRQEISQKHWLPYTSQFDLITGEPLPFNKRARGVDREFLHGQVRNDRTEWYKLLEKEYNTQWKPYKDFLEKNKKNHSIFWYIWNWMLCRYKFRRTAKYTPFYSKAEEIIKLDPHPDDDKYNT